MTHDLKILPEFFIAVNDGRMTFILSDTAAAVGDILTLREYKDGYYTGRVCRRVVTYVLSGFHGLQEGWVVMGIREAQL